MNPETEFRVRRATADDAEALADLRYEFRARRVVAVEDADGFRTRFVEWTREHLTGDGPWRTWVLEHEGETVGNVWLQIVQKLPNPGEESERHGYVTNFFIREAFRARGGGSRLLAALLEDCVALDVDSIFLWPTDQSRALYGRHGFHPGTSLMILDR